MTGKGCSQLIPPHFGASCPRSLWGFNCIILLPPKQMLHLPTATSTPLPPLIPSLPHLPRRAASSNPPSFSPHPCPHRNILAEKTSGYRRIFVGRSSSSLGSHGSPLAHDEFGDELGRLLALLPDGMRRRLTEHPELHRLTEVVMDLGRKPLARFPSGDFVLLDCPITFQDLEHAISRVGDFAIDNRAGISRTLHRISAIRNRKGAIIGLTCRVGRAISGSANLLRDMVRSGVSLLLIGPPGVGKTTIIREIARMLANDYKKRVMIVDTSNEIGGDGDIPHAGIGTARRMQVPNSDMQHKVLIEAVENHMPQVIVIDEIGTKLEAMAASTIAQRGIQLVATAHGVTIENLVMNPSLDILIGGIQSVTLGDDEASRRGVQKTVLERKGPSTFCCGVEIVSKNELRVHHSLEATVDAILSGRYPFVEVRKIKSEGLEETVQRKPLIQSPLEQKNEKITANGMQETVNEKTDPDKLMSEFPSSTGESSCENGAPLHLFVYGILEASVIQGLKQLKLDAAVQLTNNISEADALLALQARLKKNSGIQAAAKSHDIPIYVTKTSSLVQIMKAVQSFVSDHADELKDPKSEDKLNLSEKIDALEEARIAIEQAVIPKGEPVELLPRPPHLLSLQMDLIQKYQLHSEIIGRELDTRICILPFQTRADKDQPATETFEANHGIVDTRSLNGGTTGLPYSVNRLPLLPE
ncbi:protein SEEDLING PLASTID DEVELOPMENT 1 [Malania oleifera]|uniref:protein SEEDLING PLASTID DEVELOPMENT 1 n=1 Tax=Malania oleifera TaxID=397392 RepID=UPI0025AE2727|nr:protein SEEDLING PLASTID DEVELOPMENT 1 [Malania oleifera]